ncbi:MAG: transcriptional regulator NrdR [Actinomycetota bacterium]|jgi:transcriptional repressor NrdR|nr:transcriptional regulator NrdR [Actinomycetota bacterium]
MRCPYCGAEDTRVVDSRPAEGGATIRRRRSCEVCENRFTTYERRESTPMVRKRDGRIEPFSAHKVRAGVANALADREVAEGAIDSLVGEIEAFVEGHGEVTTEEIGRRVLEALRHLDEVAYLRFASVYKEFEGARDFEREMAALEDPG